MRWRVSAMCALFACGGIELASTTPGDAGNDDVVVIPDVIVDSGAPQSCQDIFPDAAPILASEAGTITPLACPPNSPQFPTAITTDEKFVYWAATQLDGPPNNAPPHGEILSCALQGCSLNPTVLATEQDYPNAIAVDTASIYWANVGTSSGSGSIMKCALGGCGDKPTELASIMGGEYVIDLAIDATSVYWATRVYNSPGRIMKCALDGSSPMVVSSAEPDPIGLAIDGVNVYWADEFDNRIRFCALAGCNDSPTTLITTNDQPTNVVTDGKYVYWAGNFGWVERCALADCSGTRTTIATDQDEPYGLAVDGTTVDWANIIGQTVAECSLPAGCGDAASVLATGQFNALKIARRGKSLFWTDYGIGYVMALRLN